MCIRGEFGVRGSEFRALATAAELSFNAGSFCSAVRGALELSLLLGWIDPKTTSFRPAVTLPESEFNLKVPIYLGSEPQTPTAPP
jgi:hypothetical protein